MKTNLFLLLILLSMGAKNYAQNVTIPDANFKSFLVSKPTINTNGDGEIQLSEANAFADTIDVNNRGISELTGIAAFTHLTGLNCYSNQISYLNLAYNTDLKFLNCGANSLTSLDVSNNTNLIHLICEINQISSLNVSNNTALQKLNCRDNPLISLNVSNNTNLINLNCTSCPITSLDLSNNTALKILGCGSNHLTSLDVSHNTALTNLICSNNSLTSLNLSNNLALYQLTCDWNQLNALSLSNNTNLHYLYCQYNSNLSCIQVWDASYASANWTVGGINISPYMYFSTNCHYVSTEEDLSSSLSILPNPASDYLYISYEGDKKVSFSIFDIWGKKLAAEEAHSAGAFYQKEVPIADFPTGIYFLVVQAGDKEMVKKFMKE